MKFDFSAGGIVSKHDKGEIFILVSQHSGHHGWVFPKGLIDKGESKETTALREVKEETGITGKIVQPLPPITFWFVLEGERHKKTVYYYLMEYVSGDTKDHDWEMENVEWLLIDQVEKRLTYASDKQVWKKAKEMIASSKTKR